MRHIIRGTPRSRTGFPAWGVLVLAAAFPSAALAQGEGVCPPLPITPVVNLYTDDGSVRFDHDVTQAQIAALYKEDSTSTHGVLGHPVGLTRTSVKFDIRTELQPVRLPDGAYCLWVTRVDAVLRYADTVIYVDKRFKPGSCQYETVLDHEHTHVAINRQTLHAHAPQIRLALDTAVRHITPVVVHDLSRDRNRPITLLHQAVEPTIEAFNKARDQANAAIDTPDNYRRTQALCQDW